MAQLHNRINREELKQRVRANATPRLTVSFYCYAAIAEPADLRNALYKAWAAIDVFGRVYLAHEGINAQVSLPETQKDEFCTLLYSVPFLNGCRLNWAIEDSNNSFYKLDIRVREKIVADGINDPTFDPSDTGTYLHAQDFNALYDAHPNLTVVDMRNHYESEVGHIKGAILPDVDTFRDQLPLVNSALQDKKNEPIVMYCTGGIRCEKASAYLKHNGYTNVFHLAGGIISYAREVREQGLESKFIGKNFVFDDRLGERITDDVIAKCHQCGAPADTHTNCANLACHLLFIQCEACRTKYEGCCSVACQDIIHLSPEEQAALRKGKKVGRQVFKKGRL